MDNEKRNKFINVRYSETEIKLIDDYVKNTNFSRSEYLRKLSLNEIKLVFPKPSEAENRPIGNLLEIKLLSNIANNINQIAKIVNQKKIAPSDEILRNIQNQIGNYLDTKF
jgi:hypothetical protein